MPISELVIPVFKAETAKEGLAALRISSKAFSGVSGNYFHSVGHVLRLNGKNVESEYRAVLGLEWDKPESFHALFPASKTFQDFITPLMPYVAEKAIPRLFQPLPGSGRSNGCFESGVTQILIGEQGNKEVVGRTWNKFVESLEQQKGNVNAWSGWGIDDAEDTWVGLLGWTGFEELESTTTKSDVANTLEELRRSVALEEMIVKFEQ